MACGQHKSVWMMPDYEKISQITRSWADKSCRAVEIWYLLQDITLALQKNICSSVFFLKLLMALEALAAGMWKLKSIGLHKRKVVSQSPPIFRGKLAVGFRGCVIMCPPKKTLDSNFLNSVNFNYLQFIVSQLDIIWPSGIVNQTLTPPHKKMLGYLEGDLSLLFWNMHPNPTKQLMKVSGLEVAGFFLVKQKTPGPSNNGPVQRGERQLTKTNSEAACGIPEGVANGGNLSKICYFHLENRGDLLICRAYCSIVWGKSATKKCCSQWPCCANLSLIGFKSFGLITLEVGVGGNIPSSLLTLELGPSAISKWFCHLSC